MEKPYIVLLLILATPWIKLLTETIQSQALNYGALFLCLLFTLIIYTSRNTFREGLDAQAH